MGYRYPEADVPCLLSDFGLVLQPGGKYRLRVLLDIAEPPATLSAEAALDVLPFEEKAVVWSSKDEDGLMQPAVDERSPRGGPRTAKIMKYEMPDGFWLFYAQSDEGRALRHLQRIQPIEKDDTVIVMFDPVARDHHIGAIYDAWPVLFTPWSRPGIRACQTAHILVGQPGKTGCYVVFGLFWGVRILERIFVFDFAKVKLRRASDGRVVLVEEK